MYLTFLQSREYKPRPHGSLLSSVGLFVYQKPLMLVHHVIMVALTVPFAVSNSSSIHLKPVIFSSSSPSPLPPHTIGRVPEVLFRGLVCWLSILYGGQHSNIITSLHFRVCKLINTTYLPLIINVTISPLQFGWKDSFIQQINGIFFVIVFFIVRIATFPFMYLVYAHRYHHDNIIAAIQEMHWFCHASMFSFYIMQGFWYIAAMKKVLRGVSRIYRKDHEE